MTGPLSGTPAVVLMDPVGASINFKPQVAERGMAVISVYTMPREYIQTRWPDHTLGDTVSLYAAELDEIRARLAELDADIRAVVPAFDVAVDKADTLAEELGLPGNGARLAAARRDKSEMREAAARSGVRIPRYELVEDPSDIARAAHAVGFPAFVKQTAGAASHGTRLLSGPGDAEDLSSLHRTDHFGRPVQAWLVEQYVRGRELGVNCVSHDGEHHVVDIWEYRQPDDRDYSFPYWDWAQIPQDDPDWQTAVDYVRQVLDAFDVHLGPSHTEIKISGGDAYLIELGARLPAYPMIDAWIAHSDLDPHRQTLVCRLGEVPKIVKAPVRHDRLSGANAIRNDGPAGRLVEIRGLDTVERLPGVDKLVVAYQQGDVVPTTDSMRTIPVRVSVSAPDHATLVERLTAVRESVQLVMEPVGRHR
ncbi:phosphoribosylglycinamide synthetase [Streptomyces pluripotens]|uniref:Phosphoribosylglycinamide synthetase n=1 Tax=Streptomyces pluripotens TaxID=1355015 RepID=A0A221P7I9_9ACTN|nr:ATP-grasp domain-containing protein [Streptomyces pluripotens]ARP73809.1 phosphoribosylglycinamide synthetase [Streptomyces pluripotens]ASN28056.1 phosphoribosylglycinamide synthetase [Streptomyces pluripotens]